VKENPSFARLKVGDLVYLGTHPWNTGDVFGHGVCVQKNDDWWLFQGAGDLRTMTDYTPRRRGTYGVMKWDSRKIIRIA
jgi:hypothetical protein